MRSRVSILVLIAALALAAGPAHAQYRVSGRVETCPGGATLSQWPVHLWTTPILGGPATYRGQVYTDANGYWTSGLPWGMCDVVVIARYNSQAPIPPFKTQCPNGCCSQVARAVNCNGSFNVAMPTLQFDCGPGRKLPCPTEL